ncbi:uncharacterized protein [Venturia canescens]|uniref:uncharacterized protein isoform X2 n=1 Tax=Venturia canescens TaxID=32260 RepID=UPI001C9C143A|nr:uncharacterized protein LOC122414279 isoform X2 [Venturia canescens]
MTTHRSQFAGKSTRVEPGSGMSNEAASSMSLPSSDMENGYVKDTSMDDAASYQVRKKHKENGFSNDTRKSDVTMYHSMMNVTEIESGSDFKQKDDSIVTDSSVMETNSNTVNFDLAPSHKRKRIRRKKSSKQGEKTLNESLDRSENENKEPKFNKPKVVGMCILPTTSTHIRFDNLDNNSQKAEDEPTGVATYNKINPNGSVLPSLKNSKLAKLSSLLDLKNCSSPLTFAPNKPKHTNSSEMPNDNENSKGNDDSRGKYDNVKPEEYPSLEAATEIGDVVAFKVLRMGSEYTPELSAYIIARTLSWCAKKQMYKFQILRGQEELKAPSGKFSLINDEAQEEKDDTVEYNFCQLSEPRLIDRKSSHA